MRLLPVGANHVGGGAIKTTPHPSDADIDAAMSGNICRCGTYQRIKEAIHTAAKTTGKPKTAASQKTNPSR